MNIQALVRADIGEDFFGAPGTLREDLAGRPVLRRTLERLASVEGLDGIVLATKPEAATEAMELAGTSGVVWMPDAADGGARDAMRLTRGFGRYGWRGGLAGTTVYDELFEPVVTAAAIAKTGADAIFLVPAGAALLEVDWAGRMLALYRQNIGKHRICFCQAPPRLAGAVFGADVLLTLGRAHLYPGRLLAYDPGRPVRDPICEQFNYMLPDWVIATRRRFLGDCPRGLWLCRRIVEEGGLDVDGQTACRIARQLPPEPWPREVTVELTTRRPVEDDLRPSADRGDLDLDVLADRLSGLEQAGDLNIMFAGAGDALLHADWPAAVAEGKKVGTVGLATYGTSLDEQVGRMLLQSGPDVVQVYADAVSDRVYAAHKRGSTASAVWANIEAQVDRQRQAARPAPMLVPTMLKTPESLDEQDEFFDKCLGLTGWGTVIEPTHAAGQWPDNAVVHMAPPKRTACLRLDTRLTLLADGRVAVCEEDILGAGALGRGTVLDAWRSDALAELRRMHAARRYDEHPICAGCEEFHRP